jgi:hypothetical protein
MDLREAVPLGEQRKDPLRVGNEALVAERLRVIGYCMTVA